MKLISLLYSTNAQLNTFQST